MLEDWNIEIDTNNVKSLPSTTALFGLEPRTEFLSRGRGSPISFAAANDLLFVATSKGFLLRHDISGETSNVSELEVLRSVDAQIVRFFVDPLGLHVLLVTQNGSMFETHYVSNAFKRSKPVAKLKGVNLTAVGWSPELQTRTLTDVVLGSATGALYTLNIDESGREKVKQVFELSGKIDAVSGLCQVALESHKRLLMVLSTTRLYTFTCDPDIEKALALYAKGSRNTKYIELPLEDGPYQLQTFCSQSLPGSAVFERNSSYQLPPPQEFAVLSPSGIYYGHVDLTARVVDETDYLVKHHLLPAAIVRQQLKGSNGDEHNQLCEDFAITLAYTQHHMILLFSSKLVFLNRISKQVVQEIPRERFVTPMRGMDSPPIYLSLDYVAGRVIVMAGDDALEVDTSNEDKNMWKVYLEKGEFDAALKYCLTPHERNAVFLAHGEFYFEEDEIVKAARMFGKLTCTTPSFEDLSLRLMETENDDAVLAFLTARLDTLGKEDKAQSTMVATWLVELMLDRINRALLNRRDLEGEAHYLQLVETLRQFLQQHVDVLDPGTIIGILSGYGRVEELLFFAKCIEDNELLLEYLVQRGEAVKAFEVLRKPSVSSELFYKFASALINLNPSLCVQSWIDAQPPLEPSRLLPALLHFGEASGRGFNDALKYIRFCLTQLGSTDVAIHNFAVSLFSLQPDSEGVLLKYLETARDPLGKPLYDTVHALRTVVERRQYQAAVMLYCELDMWEDAVQLALAFDRTMAINIAKEIEFNDSLGRKLWISIAKHIIEQDGAVPSDAAVMNIVILLEEARGVLRIEDVLPLFPDFVQIGAVKNAICRSLEKYNQEMVDLRNEMQTATQTAEAIRRNLGQLEHRGAILDLTQTCAFCSRPLYQPPPSSAGPSGGKLPLMYLFPSGNAFHCSCLCTELGALAPFQQRQRMHHLVQDLSQDISADVSVHMQECRRELESCLTFEDPYTGDIVCRNVTKPFLNDEELTSKSWDL